MKTTNICSILLVLLIFSCKEKRSEILDGIPIIHLVPGEEETFKVSDYFDRVEAVLLQGTFFFRPGDFVECPDQYIVSAVDNPNFLEGKRRFYLFDKEGHFRNCIGNIGRGAGEYQSIFNGVQVGKNGSLHILGGDKYLVYSIDGEVQYEQLLFPSTKRLFDFGSPIYLWKDSLIVFYTPSIVIMNPAMVEAQRNAPDTTSWCNIYSLKTKGFVHSYFPKKETVGLKTDDHIYDYRDTFCFYYDKDKTIYQLLPGEKKIRYRIDKGKQDRLQTMESYAEEYQSEILHNYLRLSSCNETDQYVMGMYNIKRKFYLFIYNKQTGQTKNFRWINEDLLKIGTKDAWKYFSWMSGLRFKQDYIWTTYRYDWITMMDQVKSQLSEKQWQAYCKKYPDFIRIYDILVKDKKNKQSLDYNPEEDDEKLVILKYYFK